MACSDDGDNQTGGLTGGLTSTLTNSPTTGPRLRRTAGIGGRVRALLPGMRPSLFLLLTLAGCTVEPAAAAVVADAPEVVTPAHDAAAYEAALARVESRRAGLARKLAASDSGAERAELRAEARAAVKAAIRGTIWPAWSGVPWGLGPNSTPLRPHQPGTEIACGYFVSSVLENAGLRLGTRFTYAQAPALQVQRTLAPNEADLHRFFSIPGDALARRIAGLGEGIYIIGLNNHIGFVDVEGGEVSIVHASYTGEQKVTREPLATAEVIANSRAAGYFVTPLFHDDRLVDHWLRGEPVPLRKPAG